MRKFNVEEFLTFIVLLGFSTFTFYLLATGKVNSFISPKMVKYIIFSLVVFIVLTLYQGNKIFSPKTNRPVSKSHMILILTLFIGFTAAEGGLNLSIITNKGVNLPNYVKNDKLKVPSSNNSKDEVIKDDASIKEHQYGASIEKDGVVVIGDENFYKAVNELGTNLNKYKGKKIAISGFVLRKKEFKEDEFVIARMSMDCCAADAQVIGIMAKLDRAFEFKKDAWVSVEGIIEEIEYRDTVTNTDLILPIIKVSKIENIKTPENIYVYPE
ncbi:TIGR03943 family protein [Clostridium sp.]|uniref:TIGR03943 family putative permease subunit n=1 Tax=Clostridium sp. TaxID=1506 RepID=UPI002FC5A92D